MAGKLIVLEGTDGSGKSTQFRLLCDRLQAEGRSFQRLVFPQYSEPSSALLRMYLNGEFGSHPSDVNAYAASVFFAVDRYAAWKKVWGKEYEAGGLILSDRYTTSNAVHQAAKLPPGEREEYLEWLFDLEYRRLGLPEPDLVIYLDLPSEVSERLLRRREAETGTKADIHEQDADYLRQCRESARGIARSLGWRILHCAGGTELYTPEAIHSRVWELVRPLLEEHEKAT